MPQLDPAITPSEPASSAGATSTAIEAAEFSVGRQDLLEEITQLQSAVCRKNTIPILSNILIQASGQVLHLTATDLDLSIRTSCPAKVVRHGALTISARKLYDYLRLLPNGEITVKVLANDWVQLRSGRLHTKMVGLPRANFPTLPLFPRDSSVMLEAAVLRDLISRTTFAVSNEESRYTLNGALMVLNSQGITMVATDGHRMALCEYSKCKSATPKETRILIPKKALAAIGSLLASSPSQHIQFAEDDSTLFFVIGKRLLTSRRLVGSFPNYEAVLPRDNSMFVVIGRDDLYSAIMRVAQFADQRTNAVRLRMDKNELKLSSSTVETGESEDVVSTIYDGDPMAIGFNSHYLLDFLKVASAERVRIEFKTSQTAIELKPEEPAASEPRYRYVVMPIRI